MYKSLLAISLVLFLITGAMGQNKKSNTMIKELNSYVHFHGAPAKGKILMVASSPATSKQTGWPIGFWAAELTLHFAFFKKLAMKLKLPPLRVEN